MIEVLKDQLHHITSWPIIAIGLLGCVLVGLLCIHYRLRADINALITFIRSTLRQEQKPFSFQLKTRCSQTLFNLFNAYSSRQQIFRKGKDTFDAIIGLTTRISKALTDSISTSEEVIDLLHQHLGADLTAVAIIRHNNQENRLYLERLSGIGANRLANPLITAFDHVFSTNNAKNWGYHSSDLTSIFPFHSLGIGYSLTVPLKIHGDIIGGLWLGFAEDSHTFSAEKKNIVDGIAEHAAAMLSIIDQTTAERDDSNNEKNLLLGLSHDIRSPGANALLALRELLTEDSSCLSSSQLSQLYAIERSLEEQNSLINDTLDYARYQKGLLFANTQLTSIQDLLAQTISVYSHSAAAKGLVVNTNHIENIVFRFDPRHFKRICSNLLSNAIKYTSQGQIDITCRANAGVAELTFADTGIGIPQGEASQLFEEFKRLSNAFNYPGTGLGLALCKILAKLNDADIFYRPNLKGGSTFGLRFKLSLANNKPVVNLPIFNKVLIVDDDQAVCRTNARYIREHTKELQQASSVSTARTILSQWKPDLIVSDLNLHSEKITALIDELAHIPTIIITGSAQDRDLDILQRKENVIVLEKPVSREELLAAASDLFTPINSLLSPA